MLENKQAKALLGRSVASHAFEILWRSVLLTAVLSFVYYLDKPKAFSFSDVWVTLIVVAVFHTILTLIGLLLAAGRYRRRPKGWDDD
jgi:low affinity Fe/Cu permease